MYRFFRYSGSKLKYTKLINKYIEASNSKIYCEPFIGSGAVLFNLPKKFDKYIINDIDRNIVQIYKSFKEIEYIDYVNELKNIKETFGDIKNNKESYYNFRDWFNQNYWNTNSTKEGIYLHFLANSCINSMLRFGPNGMNQSYGNRFYVLNEKTFNHISYILKQSEIYCTNYKDLMGNNFLYFLDPPYFMQASSYKDFSENDIKDFIKIIQKQNEYIYTDILCEFNKHLNKEVIREMRSSSPNSKKQKNGNIECIFSNISISQPFDDF